MSYLLYPRQTPRVCQVLGVLCPVGHFNPGSSVSGECGEVNPSRNIEPGRRRMELGLGSAGKSP